MKILVFADRLDVGGTQVNAIELSASLRDQHGHDVLLFATPGPMINLAKKKGLRFLPAPDSRVHPSPARMWALGDAVRRERPDLVHVWDWTQCLDAFYILQILMRIPMVVTVMSMEVPRLIPKAVPTTFGTPELLDKAKLAGWHRVELILPPVDVIQNSPDQVDPRPIRELYGINSGDITLVTVSRLVDWMKAESLQRTIEAVRQLGRRLPLRFIIVGDGTSRAQLAALASETNADLGRQVVVLTGPLLDPRPAYAAADIVIGMGGSALRGMAFAKPVIIVGEKGFSAPFTPNTAKFFYSKGIFGIGDGRPNTDHLIAHIRAFAEHPDQFPSLGHFSRQFVLSHFSLSDVSERLDAFFRAAVTAIPRFHVSVADGLRTAAITLGHRLTTRRIRQRLTTAGASPTSLQSPRENHMFPSA